MPSAILVKTALSNAKNRTVPDLQGSLDRLSGTLINHRSLDTEAVMQIQKAIMSGMMTAFLYGRMAAFGDQVKQSRGRYKPSPSMSFAIPDWSQTLATLLVILKYDRNLIRGLLGVIGTKLIKNEAEAFAEYFRPSEKALRFLDGYTAKLAGIVAEDTAKYVTELVRDTIAAGMSADIATDYIMGKVNSFTRRRAKAIAITEATRAYNIGTLDECQGSSILLGYRFNAVMDMLTTDICRERNDLFLPAEDIYVIANNTPPLHVNCRSNLEPVTKYSGRALRYRNINSVILKTEPMKRPEDVEAVLAVLRTR